MTVIENTKYVGWIELSKNKAKRIQTEVKGWKINYNEITYKVNFFLEEIKVKLLNKIECKIFMQNSPYICSIFMNTSESLGPVNIIYSNYFIINISFCKIKLQ